MGEICAVLNLPLQIKESLLWIYRLHLPSICLGSNVQKLLAQLSLKCDLTILTDGRSITQRNKLKALGLEHIRAYISEEYGAAKPSHDGFKMIMHDFPSDRYFYVGDNPLKDFIAPNNLGWTSICLRDDGRNVHSQDVSGLDPIQLPKIWINSLDELNTFIC